MSRTLCYKVIGALWDKVLREDENPVQKRLKRILAQFPSDSIPAPNFGR